MKKILLSLAAALCVGTALADDRQVDFNSFPNSAKEFIKKHYAKITVTSSILDTDDNEYTAYLNDGTKIEFRSSGAWKEIDGQGKPLPTSVVPAKIAKYVKANHSTLNITKIEANQTKYEVELSNGLDLEFDLQGNFLRQDN